MYPLIIFIKRDPAEDARKYVAGQGLLYDCYIMSECVANIVYSVKYMTWNGTQSNLDMTSVVYYS